MDKYKDNFLFNRSWWEVLRNLPSEVRFETYDALLEYAFGGEVPSLKPMAAVAFAFLRREIDRQRSAYETRREINRRNGSGGGNPNFRKGCPNPYYQGEEVPEEITEDNQRLPEITEDNPIEKKDNRYIKKAISKEMVKKSPEVISPSEDRLPSLYSDDIVRMWNSTCTSYSRLSGISDRRRVKLRNRLEEMSRIGEPMEVFRELLGKLQGSAFLKGDNRRGWKANFDWLIANGENWRKVMEGNYDGIDSPVPSSRPQKPTQADIYAENERMLQETLKKIEEKYGAE